MSGAPLRIGLLGAGRIGQTHARAIAALDSAAIVAVHDPVAPAREAVQALTGARAAPVDEILAASDVDAVIVATPTDAHAAQVEAAARAGKAIFCEKPLDLDVARARACLEVADAAGAPLMLGFNRRFDPHFAEVKRRIDGGEIGRVEMVLITSRDPSPPPLDYVRRSGGLFRDMMIHDIDLARFLLGEGGRPAEISEVIATGAALVDPAIAEAGDIDSAAAILRTGDGRMAQISNARRAVYGYDQRVEAHGASGLLSAENVRTSTVTIAKADGTRAAPLEPFFMERYAAAYAAELAAFVDAVRSGRPPSPDGRDGVAALEIADAAARSLATGAAKRLGGG